MINKDKIIREANKVFDLIVFDKKHNPLLLSNEDILVIKDKVKKDLDFFFESDPAANNLDEIKITYPGFKAITFYRIANVLYKNNLRSEARIITEHAHFLTGIDINPGATIGTPFFIDHGTGVVIGETSIIGNFVRLYQGVTLGALSPEKGQSIKGVKRHPTVGDNVTIYAGASILGDISIGNNCTIGGGVFLLDTIGDNMKVTNPKPILNIKEKKK